MTREEARHAAEVMMAYAEGKEIELNGRSSCGCQMWKETSDPTFNWYDFMYRTKTKPKYRPFKTREECWNEMMKHQPFGWVKEISSEMLYLINGISDMSIVIMEDISSFKEAMNIYEFKDGAPFGVVEELL